MRYRNSLLEGAFLPDARAGYEPGETFLKNAGGRQGMYINRGTRTANNFQRIEAGQANEYVFVDAGTTFLTTGVTAQQLQTRQAVTPRDLAFAEYATSDDSDQPTVAKVNAYGQLGMTVTDPLSAHSMSWAILGLGRLETFAVFAAGTFTTVGGDVAESIPVTGALVGDICLVQVQTVGTGARTVDEAIVAANAITVEMSGDPAANTVLNYVVLRLVGTFRPSHYVAFGGTYVCATADAAGMAIAVSGAKTTDIPFSSISKTDDSDVIVSTKVSAANVLTLTASADPDVAGTHEFDYFILRAM